jgi:hypothetical protein
MPKADQFRQYAEEAMRWAFQSKTEKEKQAYTDLALTWMQVAVQTSTFSASTTVRQAAN